MVQSLQSLNPQMTTLSLGLTLRLQEKDKSNKSNLTLTSIHTWYIPPTVEDGRNVLLCLIV